MVTGKAVSSRVDAILELQELGSFGSLRATQVYDEARSAYADKFPRLPSS